MALLHPLWMSPTSLLLKEETPSYGVLQPISSLHGKTHTQTQFVADYAAIDTHISVCRVMGPMEHVPTRGDIFG